MTNTWALCALWVGLALVATLLAIWFKISTALSEIVVGTVAQLVIGAFLAGSSVLRSAARLEIPSGSIGADLDSRLKKLERAWHDVVLLQMIEAVATRHGLVELRSRIASLAARLQTHIVRNSAKCEANRPMRRFHPSSSMIFRGYSSFGIAVDRKHTLKWLFYQERATLYYTQKACMHSETALMNWVMETNTGAAEI